MEFSGVVTAVDLQQCGVATWEIEKVRPVTPHRITDLSGVTDLQVDFNSVWQLAENRKNRQFPNAFKSAIVAPENYLMGYARMFQTLNDHPQITICVFKDRAAAQTWLDESA